MSAADAGGPAFPVDNVVRRDEKGYLVGCEVSSAGMTLRDYFAAKVIKECVNVCATNTSAAKEAYKIADAMLEARK